MIPRYAPKEMTELFSDQARFAMWLRVELLATEGWVAVGDVPAQAAAVCRDRAPEVDAVFVEAVAERERVTDHDVAAFVDVVQQAIGQPEGSWIHYGLTSSDVVDTALCATLTRAADLLIVASTDLVRALKARANQLIDVPVTGRTHGMHAEPTTYGAKFALWALQADRDRQRLVAARARVAVGKLSGAVGTYSNIDPRVEDHVCHALGLTPTPATQVVARDRHAEYLWACASVATSSSSIMAAFMAFPESGRLKISQPTGPCRSTTSGGPLCFWWRSPSVFITSILSRLHAGQACDPQDSRRCRVRTKPPPAPVSAMTPVGSGDGPRDAGGPGRASPS